MNARTTTAGLDPNQQAVIPWLLAATALVTAPHALHIAPFLFAFFAAMLGWRLLIQRRPAAQPGPALLLGVTGLGIGLLVVAQQGVLGRDAGTGLFVVALGLKLLEIRRPRDVYLVIFLSLFVAVTQFLYSQTPFMALYILASVGLLLAALIALHTGADGSRSVPLRQAGRLILQAIPLTALLFLFFPRIPAPRVALPIETAGSGVTGLGETLAPGEISQLTGSGALAFRAEFDGALPPPEARYWRALVFWHSDGRRWRLPERRFQRSRATRFRGPAYRYSITLEPHGKRWLFALDRPASLPPKAHTTPDGVLVADAPIDHRSSYRLVSYTDYNSGPLTARERRLGLQLPQRPSPRMARLIAAWRRQAQSNADIVNLALRYFHDQPFRYTLVPRPLGGRDPTDAFLFDVREGFCEHYASAFVLLMRHAGIPARIVTGYQGGEVNPVGHFIEVRQDNAHAWAEVWLAGRGWVRVDPTLAVPPERVDGDAGAQRTDIAGQRSAERYQRQPTLARLADSLRYGWAAVDHNWHRWVIRYTASRQQRLFSSLGIEGAPRLVLLMLCGLAVVTALLAALVLYRRAPRQDKVVRLYRRFNHKLARIGLDRKPAEGAVAFALRAAAQRPDLARAIDDITRLYVRIRYGKSHRPADIHQLARLVRGFRA